jgi:ATP-dependent protease Clp ATPase subunit
MLRLGLRCSFCRRRDAEVSKLVAGPRFSRMYICDLCAAEAVRIMNDADRQNAGAASTPARPRRGVWARVRSWISEVSKLHVDYVVSR